MTAIKEHRNRRGDLILSNKLEYESQKQGAETRQSTVVMAVAARYATKGGTQAGQEAYTEREMKLGLRLDYKHEISI